MSVISYQLSSTREFEFLLHLLKIDEDSLSKIASLLAKKFAWEILAQSTFLPQLHLKLQKLPEDFPIPESFKRMASQSYHQNSLLNDFRVRWMRGIHQGLKERGIEILYLKGAAEIIDHNEQLGYLGSRPMGDIDFACKESDYIRIHSYLLEHGNTFANRETSSKSLKYILEMTGHFSYNPYNRKVLEMHVDSYMFKHQQDNYPPEFARDLFQRARRVQINDSEFVIPSREDMLIYLICHAAGEKDYKSLCNRPFHTYDYANRRKGNIKERINNRFSYHQIRFLYQIDLLLGACQEKIDFDGALSELSRVKYKPLIQQHIELIHFYTELDVFRKFMKHQTQDALLSSRQRELKKLVASQALLLGFKYLFKEPIVLLLKNYYLKVKCFVGRVCGYFRRES